jgi:hypothetical protein
MVSGLWYARVMSLLTPSSSLGGKLPYLVGLQLGLLLLVTPVVITPPFQSAYADLDCCLPLVTDMVMSPLYGPLGGLLICGMLARAFLQRARLSRPELLAWSAVLLGIVLVLLYIFGIFAPLSPL